MWLFIRGICGNPDDCQEWEQYAVDWVHQNTDSRARADSYRCSALTVWMHEEERCRSFAEVLSSYTDRGFSVNIVAHSNGTRVALEGMRLANYPRVEAVHLVCGACDADFERNGLNRALRLGKLGRVFVYRGGKDFAMVAEDTMLGKLLFDLPGRDRPLGLQGPKNEMTTSAAGLNKRVQQIVWDDYGHSTCWDSNHFDGTLRQITAIR